MLRRLGLRRGGEVDRRLVVDEGKSEGPLVADEARDRAFDDSEAFCAEQNKTNSVRDVEIVRERFGVTVHRWFKCL